MLTAIARLLLSAAEPVLRLLDIDTRAVQAIVEAKLIADRRRVPPSFGAVRRDKVRNWFVWQIALYGFVGLALSITMFVGKSPAAGLLAVHMGILVLLALAVLSDFSTVLLDTTDVAVLEARPLTQRTILAARLVHVVLYVGAIVASLGWASWIACGVKFGWRGALGFGLSLVSNTALIMGTVTLLFLSSMRFFSSRHLKTLVLWSQILATLTFLFGFQLMPQMLGLGLDSATGDTGVWPYFFPPAWMAGLSTIGGAGLDRRTELAALGALVPLVILLIANRLSSGFRPSALRDPSPVPARLRPARRPWVERLASRLTRNPVEAAYFAWTWRQVSRETSFKLRVYPSLVMSLVFPPLFLFVLPRSGSWDDRLAELREGDLYLFVLYFASLSLLGCLLMIRISDRPEAKWIHEVCPVPGPGDALVAALKVILLRFELPLFTLTGGLVLAVWGFDYLGDVLLAGAATFLMATMEGRGSGQEHVAEVVKSPDRQDQAAREGEQRQLEA
ncbi:MAG: hypothetical protein RL885_06275, partial [Planctomycetota bacterium]